MLNLRIVLGDNDEDFILNTSSILNQLGYSVVAADTSGTALLRKIRALNPDIVIADVNLRGISGFEISDIVEGEEICPCVITFKNSPSEYSLKLQEKLVYAYLQKPLSYGSIEYVIDNAYINFKRLMEYKTKLKERKAIEKAKGILMKKYKLSEEKAYEYMRKKSMDRGISLYKVSLAIIDIIEKDKK
ncbi:ANTAR domain-containing response regulator [Fonticella tunisiensis]|uniref:Stage 0 sporulation protein A homolog n=1 Tax=Fonticella tunisiensis TaxID=1096341 RepID=A0A4R7K8Z6_9CLOT|nr:ANTAR domain-containing protein [Fonticella tunisiensis]TDT50478.1 response regulator receiver and ANTAR domain protein [Fonticella tunisiensis]